ncbi:sigma-54-dependent Fis family transcriptional regulator [candidate division KSB3 bacterium]|uniref:Sigma-54-dependent Fis family transcriptional regulator n=1 Tax=candidate division KSB3 bacterium TaxID=2044937 RepID=A0A2G6K9Y5_9BACT|nr:MAG: sigma-54-dependent Fis family transcriptional regulator [candidate division KSB3 bacterium]
MTNPIVEEQATVLVVDDDQSNLHLLVNYLSSIGFKVLPLKHGEHVFELLNRQQPDMILLDILMPDIDGFEICRRLKASPETRNIPVIFMSALSETIDKVKGLRLGAVDYITKPLQLEETLARIQTHLTIRRLQQQLQDQNTFLARQKIRFERLAEATFEGIVIQNDERIVEANEALLTLFTYQRDELFERPFLDLIHPSERDAVEQYLLNANTPPYQTCGLRKDGSAFFIEMQTKTMPYQETALRVIAIRDITWCREMEQKTAQLERENIELRANIKERYRFGDIIGKSQAMQDIYERILNAAASDAHVAIYGESGTGKELIAHTIHAHSSRHTSEFVTVNCGALPENLFESEFFGYRKGAFTGANHDKPGYFDLAHRGTLFLDEVGELTVTEQVKLLRVIETGEYRPLGSTVSSSVDVRIIAATNRNVTELRRQGLLRDDFFYRVHVITFTTPPLRERKDDIPLLIDHFLEQHTSIGKRPVLPGKIAETLYAYNWPGNVRELRNVLHRYLAGQPLEFDEAISSESHGFNPENLGEEIRPLRATLEAFEKRYILMALNEHRWHREHTAKALKLPLRTLQRKMKNLGLSKRKNMP